MSQHSLGKVVTSVIVGASLLSGQVAVASVASAGDPYGSHRRGPASRHYEAAPRSFGPFRESRRDRAGDAVAGIVLGIGALVVGAAIADAARHNKRTQDHYEE